MSAKALAISPSTERKLFPSVSAPRNAVETDRATPSARLPIRSSSPDTPDSSSRKSPPKRSPAIGKALHQCFEPCPVERVLPVPGNRAPGRGQFARAHLPESLGRQPQDAEPKAHRFLPGKGVHAASPNVALSSRTAISAAPRSPPSTLICAS